MTAVSLLEEIITKPYLTNELSCSKLGYHYPIHWITSIGFGTLALSIGKISTLPS